LLRKGDYVYGSFVKPEAVDGFINGVNPGDRSDVLGRFPFSGASLDDAMDCASQGFRVWRRMSINERAGAVHRFRDHVARAQEPLARLLTREAGKPLWEARQELLATIRALDLMLDDGVNTLAPRVIDEIGARSDRVPRGVVGIFTPFNFPLMVAATHTAAAVLSGNAVVVKPSKFTPGIGQAHAELWDRCQLPRGVVNMVQGPGSVIGQRLATHPGLDVLCFTGSYATSQAIAKLTVDRPELPTLLQCGGKGTAIVLDDAELERAVYEVMIGAFITSGQRHNSTGRVIVTSGIYDRFVELLASKTSNLSVGYGFDPGVFAGPVISENLRTRYRRFARNLVSKGHKPLLETSSAKGGRRGFYVRPAIYEVAWDNSHPFLDREPPGPLLMVYKVADWAQAVALHNQIDARIATSLFLSTDNPYLSDIRDRLRTGALNINRGTIGASLRLPSVGLGTSSNGTSGGLQVLNLFTHPRSQLTEVRSFSDMPMLPGVSWDGPEEVLDEPTDLPPADEPTEIGDLSSLLELAEF
jgi:succinylglutamic semialdehyde dehydrogenase